MVKCATSSCESQELLLIGKSGSPNQNTRHVRPNRKIDTKCRTLWQANWECRCGLSMGWNNRAELYTDITSGSSAQAA
jgi:hypothetical protein